MGDTEQPTTPTRQRKRETRTEPKPAESGPDDDARGTAMSEPGGAAEPHDLLGPRAVLALGGLLVALGLVSLYALIAIWPAVEAATATDGERTRIRLFGVPWRPTAEVALLLLVAFSSALGSSLHAMISFTDYAGNRRLAKSWVWWYVLRVFVGTALAVLFYFALRGGLFSANTPTDVINPFGIAALAGLVGLFSKQATDKLREIFDTMFRTAPGQGDDQRGDGITNPRPVVGGAMPPRIKPGAAVLDVGLNGDGFLSSSIVRVSRRRDGLGPVTPRATEYVSPALLRVRLVAEDMLDEGTLYLTVLNPPPGGGLSGPAELEIHPAEVAKAMSNGGDTDTGA